MNRRQIIITAAATTSLASVGWPTLARADLPKVQSLSDALRWLDALEKSANANLASPKSPAQTTGAWGLPAVLEHLAQSIEMSMDGFPAPKSALFQAVAGRAAFAVFQWRGQMTHSLSEPIPGAPPLTTATDWKPASLRLRSAITRFNAHSGALQPHFAYGALSKADFAQAHAFHMANHQDEIVIAA